MKEDIKYFTLDGRGQTESFRTHVLDALEKLGPREGLHIIKEFEPIPLYALIGQKGLEKRVEKKSDNEYHVWFFPKKEIEDIEMKKYLTIDNERVKKMLDIKLMVFNREITPYEARKLVNATFDYITAEEFAYGEQHMFNAGITDEIMAEGMDDILDVFEDVLVVGELGLPKGHPIQTYAEESAALKELLLLMEQKMNGKFIKNEWLELYSKLSQINTHFSRKQHQLFSALERKGFDRPSKIMWTFDDKVRDAVKDAYELLQTDNEGAFLKVQPNVFHLVRDILQKENDVLYPTSLKLLNTADFTEMRISDDEIGYCLIENPPAFNGSDKQKIVHSNERSGEKTENLLYDLNAVLEKHGLASLRSKDEELDVSIGKLTLDQINLIYKHMKVDLSYVDENNIVKFYTDTEHRVFPRSAGVIGRMVQNCHPRDSVATVEAIIKAFRNGEQDEAEFWLEKGGKFIYIIYNAVRDDQGNFKGVLEMMQDVTHIRSLTGSQKLLSWKNK
jgi:DUF438 domain-containing protein